MCSTLMAFLPRRCRGCARGFRPRQLTSEQARHRRPLAHLSASSGQTSACRKIARWAANCLKPGWASVPRPAMPRSAAVSSIRSRRAAFPRARPALPQRSLGGADRPRRRSPTRDWIAHFGRFEPLPGSFAEPLALRYHGHQFRAYNPDLGDGRGFLFAQAARPRRRPPARPRHQGLRPHALVARRRRPPDAEGRRARDPRHRDARGARASTPPRPSR